MEIRKTLGITKEESLDTFCGYSSENLEQKSQIEVISSGNLNAAFKEWEKIDNLTDREFNLYKCDINLSPSEITKFSLDYVLGKNENSRFRVGRYLTNLIQNSYNKGSNNFIIVRDNILNLGINLKAVESNPLNIYVSKSIGLYFCLSSKKCDCYC